MIYNPRYMEKENKIVMFVVWVYPMILIITGLCSQILLNRQDMGMIFTLFGATMYHGVLRDHLKGVDK